MPTFAQTLGGYSNLWNRATITPTDRQKVFSAAKDILANKSVYKGIELTTAVPWYFIGPIHYRESSFSFKKHLHNGDSLGARTVHVPAGRPARGNPPFSWQDSARDALTMAPHSLHKVQNWSIERTLYETERYNGWGYIGKCNSPYIWSGTNLYTGGKYVADHVFSSTAWDKQLGCAAILKALIELDPEVKEAMSVHEAGLPPDVNTEDKESKIKKDKAKKVGAGTGSAAGGGTVVVSTQDDPVSKTMTPFLGLLCIVLIVGTIFYIVNRRKKDRKLAEAAWRG